MRLGRVSFPGPIITGVENQLSHWHAQDAFATELDTQFQMAGERFKPSTDRYGSCAFSAAQDIYEPDLQGSEPILLMTPGDSILVQVTGRPNAEITAVRWFGAIVAGPHAGKAPSPHAVLASGFFDVTPTLFLDETGAVVEGLYFVDLDDTYFRGGDVLRYLWLAEDDFVTASAPAGLSGVPMSVQEAEQLTGGLLEVNFLPTIDWDPGYLARIAGDLNGNGDLDPTPEEIMGSSQSHCFLYVNRVNPMRRSGDVNRTSFMYTLDRLGYRDEYDVYDVMGTGTANNDLASRATNQQAQGYALIIHDTGRGKNFPLPRGDGGSEKLDQASWYQTWLQNGSLNEPHSATLWLIGEDLVQMAPGTSLLSTTAGVTLVGTNQGMTVNPTVDGVDMVTFTFENGTGTSMRDFSGESFSLHGGCPGTRDYDGLGAGATALITHRYKHPSTSQMGPGAVVMNKNTAENWNTIMMSFPWFDVVPLFNTTPSSFTPPEILAVGFQMLWTPPDRDFHDLSPL